MNGTTCDALEGACASRIRGSPGRSRRENPLLFVIPAKEHVKKSRGATTLRHSRESGNLLRRFRKKNRAGIADGRPWIPAFERVKKSDRYTNTRHSRESGNLFAAFPQEKPSRHSGRPPPDSRFRGNDEVLFDGYCLLQCRYLGDPSVTMRAARFLHTLFRGKDEALFDGYCLYNADASAIRPSREESTSSNSRPDPPNSTEASSATTAHGDTSSTQHGTSPSTTSAKSTAGSTPSPTSSTTSDPATPSTTAPPQNIFTPRRQTGRLPTAPASHMS